MSDLFQDAMTALAPLKAKAFPDRVTRDEDAVLIAMSISLRADCTRRRVGAVVIDPHGRVIGAGRNGAPPGYAGCLSAGACPRGQQDFATVKPGSSYSTSAGVGACIANHAEVNALLFTDPHARRGGIIAVSDAPCDDCSRALAGSGLSRVLWPEQDADGEWVVAQRAIGPGEPIGGHYP